VKLRSYAGLYEVTLIEVIVDAAASAKNLARRAFNTRLPH